MVPCEAYISNDRNEVTSINKFSCLLPDFPVNCELNACLVDVEEVPSLRARSLSFCFCLSSWNHCVVLCIGSANAKSTDSKCSQRSMYVLQAQAFGIIRLLGTSIRLCLLFASNVTVVVVVIFCSAVGLS